MTKIDVLSDFNAEHCLRLSSRRTQILYPAMPINLTFAVKRRALLTSKHTFTHTFAFSFVPHSHLAPVPCLSLMLQDGRWVKEGKMAASLRETDEPSTWFRCARVFCVILASPSSQGNCYGFVLPAEAASQAPPPAVQHFTLLEFASLA